MSDSVSLPDLIAIFIGVLELVKIRRILIDESAELSELPEGNLHGNTTRFIINADESSIADAAGDIYN